MKKLWILIVPLFVYILGSCALKEPDLKSDIGVSYPLTSNPLVVVSAYTLSYKLGYSSPQNRFADTNPDSTGIQDEVIMNFSAPFSVREGGIVVRAVSGKDSGNVNVTYVVDNYEKQLRILFDGIQDSTTYEIKLLASYVKDLSGNALDGNFNGRPDSVYDDFVFYVRGPRPNADIPDNTPMTIWWWFLSDYVDGNGMSNDTIFVVFNRDVDISTVDGNFALYSYPDGVDYTQNITHWDSVTSMTLYFAYSGLPTGKAYVFVLKDGLKDTEGRGFDGNGNGILELHDTATLYFKVAVGDSMAVTYPEISNLSGENSKLILEFTKPMDIQSINDSTVIVYDVSGNRVNARLNLYPDREHLSIEPLLPLSEGSIFLSRNLKDTMGLKFDGNGNGFGGEPDVDDRVLNF